MSEEFLLFALVLLVILVPCGVAAIGRLRASKGWGSRPPPSVGTWGATQPVKGSDVKPGCFARARRHKPGTRPRGP